MSTGNRVVRARILVLVASFIGFALSIYLWFTGHQMQGIFVGLWVPSILSLGTLVIPNAGRAP